MVDAQVGRHHFIARGLPSPGPLDRVGNAIAKRVPRVEKGATVGERDEKAVPMSAVSPLATELVPQLGGDVVNRLWQRAHGNIDIVEAEHPDAGEDLRDRGAKTGQLPKARERSVGVRTGRVLSQPFDVARGAHLDGIEERVVSSGS